MKYFITGAGGFVGSNLTDRLLADGHSVVGYDNFSTGKKQFLSNALRNKNFRLVVGDIHDRDVLEDEMQGCDFVFHLAANADVRFGFNHPYKDLEQNTISTFYVLEAMRANGIKNIAFSSTGSIYGENQIYPTPENAPFPVQTSLYGASKLACEGMIQAYCEGYDFTSYIFRFVSVMGERYTHGLLFNFKKELLSNPEKLTILGNGTQSKSYIYIQDILEGILIGIEKPTDKVNIYNIGTDETMPVNKIIDIFTNYYGINPDRCYTGGSQGYPGDIPRIWLNCNKLRNLGWNPRHNINDAIIKTLQYFDKNEWIFQARGEM